MSVRDALPKATPDWLRRLLLDVEIDLEEAATNRARTVCGSVEELDRHIADHREEAHQRLRDVLFGPDASAEHQPSANEHSRAQDDSTEVDQ